MNILLATRSNLHDLYGGDANFIFNLKERMEANGHNVRIDNKAEPDLENVEVVHCFDITRVHETYMQLMTAKHAGVPVVLTPNYHDLTEMDKHGRRGGLRVLYRFLKNPNIREYLKTAARGIMDKRQRRAAFAQLKVGYEQQQRAVLRGADMVMPSTRSEQALIAERFGVASPSTLIPYVVETAPMNASPQPFVEKYEKRGFVLCAARIEARKNQLNLIRALWNEPLDIVCIGNINPANKRYTEEFRRLAEKRNVLHIQNIDRDMLFSAYAACKVHVLPSWFEVTGMSTLEAGLAGANAVSTDRGYTHEQFRYHVWYCDPSDLNSIRRAVSAAYEAPAHEEFRQYVEDNFTWNAVLPLLESVYEKVVREKR